MLYIRFAIYDIESEHEQDHVYAQVCAQMLYVYFARLCSDMRLKAGKTLHACCVYCEPMHMRKNICKCVLHETAYMQLHAQVFNVDYTRLCIWKSTHGCAKSVPSTTLYLVYCVP